MRHYDIPLIGVGVCVRKEERILLHLRKGNHGAGTWGLPGGHLEKWEGLEECILREVVEECGPQFHITYPILWTVENTFFRSEDRHYILLAYVSNWVEGEPLVMEPEKNEGWEWFSWNALPPNLMKGIRQIHSRGLNPFNLKGL